MPKKNRGGKRTVTSLSGGGVTASNPNDQQIQQQTPTPTMSATYNQFINMTDDQKADVIDNMIQNGVPVHLADNAFQRFVYNIGLNDKPDVVDDTTLAKMNGKTLYRTVNLSKDTTNKITYTAPEIAKQVIGGKYTRVSDSGGSVHGKGIYFANDKRASHLYGRTYGDVNKTAVMKAKLNGNAKIINSDVAKSGVMSEIRKGTKLGKVLNKVDYNSQVSLYSMAKGYNVISNGRNYLNVLNRNAITMSKDIDAMI